MYLQNKYTKWYFSIITSALTRTNLGYTETHHIIPKSLGGSNNSLNLVKLTSREHYICHLLLTKMTDGINRYKMLHAVSSYISWSTKKHNRNIKINSRIIENLKKDRSSKMKEEMNLPENKRRSSEAAKLLWSNTEHRQKQSQIRKKLWEDIEYVKKMNNRKTTAKSVIINEIIYSSQREAATKLNLNQSTISRRCSSQDEKYANWKFL